MCKARLQKVVGDDQVSIKILGDTSAGPASPMRPDLLGAINQATEKIWPGVPVVPIMVMGATDGKYLRIAGIPTYGVQGFFFDRNDIRFHGRDERTERPIVLRRPSLPLRPGETPNQTVAGPVIQPCHSHCWLCSQAQTQAIRCGGIGTAVA